MATAKKVFFAVCLFLSGFICGAQTHAFLYGGSVETYEADPHTLILSLFFAVVFATALTRKRV